MSSYANAPTTQSAGQTQQFGSPQMTDSAAAGSANDYYQQSGQQYNEPARDANTTSPYGQQTNTTQQAGQVPNGKAAGGQLGAGEPAQAEEQDGMHKFLDKVEKKFGGERFNNPDNYEKNKKMNDSLILKLKQVAKVVMKKAPRMIMNMAR